MRYFFAHFASFWLGARKLNNVQVTKMKWLHLHYIVWKENYWWMLKILRLRLCSAYAIPKFRWRRQHLHFKQKKKRKNVQNNLTCAQFAKSHSYHKYLWFHSTVEINLIILLKDCSKCSKIIVTLVCVAQNIWRMFCSISQELFLLSQS